jgi:hypothetical protein
MSETPPATTRPAASTRTPRKGTTRLIVPPRDALPSALGPARGARHPSGTPRRPTRHATTAPGDARARLTWDNRPADRRDHPRSTPGPRGPPRATWWGAPSPPRSPKA